MFPNFYRVACVGYVLTCNSFQQPIRWSVFVLINYKNEHGRDKLSITGVVGPKHNCDARGSCGQCVDSVREATPATGYTKETLTKLADYWDRWHLNNMRAGCEHQRANWGDTTEKVEVVSYGLTTAASLRRTKVLESVAKEALAGRLPQLDATDRALAELEDWFRDRHVPPDADSPLSGCYEVRKREQKAIGWVYPHEHPRGILGKKCDVCSYRYGTAHLHEEVPHEVLQWLHDLPDASEQLPACWHSQR